VAEQGLVCCSGQYVDGCSLETEELELVLTAVGLLLGRSQWKGLKGRVVSGGSGT
jgi:hypothetical protein